jgi:hypothetical protein
MSHNNSVLSNRVLGRWEVGVLLEGTGVQDPRGCGPCQSRYGSAWNVIDSNAIAESMEEEVDETEVFLDKDTAEDSQSEGKTENLKKDFIFTVDSTVDTARLLGTDIGVESPRMGGANIVAGGPHGGGIVLGLNVDCGQANRVTRNTVQGVTPPCNFTRARSTVASSNTPASCNV